MIRTFSWFRAILLIETRALWRSFFRTLLVALLVGVPVAAIVFANNLLLVSEATPNEKAVAKLGQADLRIDSFYGREKLTQQLPSAAQLESLSFGSEPLILFGQSVNVQTCRVTFDGLARGMVQRVDGSSPRLAGEVAVSPQFMKLAQKGIGDTIQMPIGGTVQIVGVVEFPESIKKLAVFYPHHLDEPWGRQEWLVKLPSINGPVGKESANRELVSIDGENRYFDEVTKREQLLNSSRSDVPIVFLFGCLAFAIAALVIAASYIVTIQRRQREIGLLAAAGATRFQLMCSVWVSAILTALLGGGIGVLSGIGVARLIHPWLDYFNGRRNGPFEIDWPSHGSAMLLGIVTCCLAAALPAWRAARVPVKQALTSRRPIASGTKRWSLVGLAFLVVGVACVGVAPLLMQNGEKGDADNLAMFAILGGSLFCMMGLGLSSSSMLVWLARRADSLPLSWRLAVRETGRFHIRNGPVITAILAGMSMTILLGTIYQSVLNVSRRDQQSLAANQVLLRGSEAERFGERIAKSIDGVRAAKLEVLAVDEDPIKVEERETASGHQVAVATRALLDGLGYREEGERLLKELESGRVLPLVAWDRENVNLLTADCQAIANLEVVSSGSHEGRRKSGPIAKVGFLVSKTTMWELSFATTDQQLSINPEPPQLLWFRKDVETSTLEKLQSLSDEYPNVSIVAAIDPTSAGSPLWFLFLAAFLLGLTIIAIATALAGEEAKHDQRTLETIGASPAVYQHQAAARSGMLALLGSWLSIPAGVIPAYGILSLIPQLKFGLPWTEIMVVAFGLPIVAYGLTWMMAWLGNRLKTC